MGQVIRRSRAIYYILRESPQSFVRLDPVAVIDETSLRFSAVLRIPLKFFAVVRIGCLYRAGASPPNTCPRKRAAEPAVLSGITAT